MADNREFVTTEIENGSINISNEVIITIAAAAAIDVDGVHGLYLSHGKDIVELLSKKNLSRGVRVRLAEGELTVDIYVMVKLGTAVNEVGAAVQKAVSSSVEATTGITAAAVSVHICGVSLK